MYSFWISHSKEKNKNSAHNRIQTHPICDGSGGDDDSICQHWPFLLNLMSTTYGMLIVSLSVKQKYVNMTLYLKTKMNKINETTRRDTTRTHTAKTKRSKNFYSLYESRKIVIINKWVGWMTEVKSQKMALCWLFMHQKFGKQRSHYLWKNISLSFIFSDFCCIMKLNNHLIESIEMAKAHVWLYVARNDKNKISKSICEYVKK